MFRIAPVLAAVVLVVPAAPRAGHAQAPAAPAVQRLQPVADAKARNVVFILADDHRYDAMGFLGHPIVKTPNMDRMARQGVHLRNAFVTTALCSPSRATILTGLYAHQHKVVDNNSPVPAGTVFFPQYLQQAGYQTAFVGKWHMGTTTTVLSLDSTAGSASGAGHLPAQGQRAECRRPACPAEGVPL